LNFRVSPARDDWFRIPELADAYSRVRGSVRDQDAEELAARLAAFRVIALTSPDLLPAHAKALYAQVEEEFCAFLPDRIGEPPRANIGLGPVTRGAGLGLEDGPKRLANFNPFAVSADGDGRVN